MTFPGCIVFPKPTVTSQSQSHLPPNIPLFKDRMVKRTCSVLLGKVFIKGHVPALSSC